MFCRIAENANTNENLNTDLRKIFDEIENSASGYSSEQDIKALNSEIKKTVKNIDRLRSEIDKIIAEIEGKIWTKI